MNQEQMKRRDKLEQVKDETGYRRLWAAVLKNAIAEMDNPIYKRGATDWIFSDKHGVGSMSWICDVLDLDHRKLQALCMTRNGRRKILRKPQ